MRLCIDYWMRNKVTIKIKYPLPCIDDILIGWPLSLYFKDRSKIRISPAEDKRRGHIEDDI